MGERIMRCCHLCFGYNKRCIWTLFDLSHRNSQWANRQIHWFFNHHDSGKSMLLAIELNNRHSKSQWSGTVPSQLCQFIGEPQIKYQRILFPWFLEDSMWKLRGIHRSFSDYWLPHEHHIKIHFIRKWLRSSENSQRPLQHLQSIQEKHLALHPKDRSVRQVEVWRQGQILRIQRKRDKLDQQDNNRNTLRNSIAIRGMENSNNKQHPVHPCINWFSGWNRWRLLWGILVSLCHSEGTCKSISLDP